jgi:FkbM family methyltransferase
MIDKFIQRVVNGTKYQHSRRSYSQCGEDLIIKHIFDCLRFDRIKYIDIGAYHPYKFSNTAFFYETGSHGINVEPNPICYAEFQKIRKRDININCGVSDVEGTLDFYVMNSAVLSTFSKAEADTLCAEYNYKVERQLKVDVYPIQKLLDKNNGGLFPELMSVDVEGLDDVIIRSLSFEISRPVVICLETISYSENRDGIKNTDLIEYLKDKGFQVYADTNINTIFIDQKVWSQSKN